jgi:antitoxin PrlF
MMLDRSINPKNQGPFLDLLAQDIEHNPQRLQPISYDLIDRIRSIVSNVDFDLTESIDEDE